MSNDNTSTTSKSLAEIQANVEMNMDDVVNVFVTQLETKLHDRKDSLQASIKRDKQALEDLVDQITKAADYKQFDTELAEQQIALRGSGASLSDSDGLHLSISILIVRIWDGKIDVHNRVGSYTRRAEVSDDIKSTHEALTKQIREDSSALAETISQLSGLARKERQVRGEISKRKLAKSGMAELLEDPKLLALVQL